MSEVGSFETGGLLPEYINNARIQVTDDNVFVDFGFADPFDLEGEGDVPSTVRARIIMNRSTGVTFSSHLAAAIEGVVGVEAVSLGSVTLSRCPVKE